MRDIGRPSRQCGCSVLAQQVGVRKRSREGWECAYTVCLSSLLTDILTFTWLLCLRRPLWEGVNLCMPDVGSYDYLTNTVMCCDRS